VRWSFLFCLMVLLSFVPVRAQVSWNISSPNLTVAFQGADIVGLVNHLTGESLGFEEPKRLDLSSVALMKRKISTDDMALASLQTGTNSTTVLFQGGGALYSMTCWSDPTGDVVLTQYGECEDSGVAEVWWGIGRFLAAQADLIVPGASGTMIDSTYPLKSYRFAWPTMWEAQMIILQTAKGGFLIWSDDTKMRFKDFTYRNDDGYMRLAFGTQNTAPFQNLTNITSTRWRITAFKGDWRAGAAIYRRWMEKARELEPVGEDVPWTKDVRFVVIMNTDKDLLQTLAERVNASATLLYLPNWRYYQYDRYYPNYTASPGFQDFVSEAHGLGFKVMVHVNYFGVSPDHPLYQSLKRYQMRDPYTGEALWWEWTRAEPPIHIAYINPASALWRSILTERLRDVRARYGVDAFHLDCTLAVFNDANGLIDGLTSTQGNLELHRQLRDSLPGVAIGGEGLNEVTLRYEDFAQRHVLLGINHFDGTWDKDLIDHLHPISAYLFTPFNTMYGYLGICDPDSNPELWRAWDTAYESLGVVPTLWLRRENQLFHPGPEMKGLMAKAKYFTTSLPRPVFPRPDPAVKFSYVTREGGHLSYRQRDFGVVLEEREGPKARIIAGRVQNSTCAKTEGTIPGWLAYNRTHLFGLDPTKVYVLLGRERDLASPHISSLPPNVVVRRAANRSSFFSVSLIRKPAPLFDFVSNSGSASKAIALPNGTQITLKGGATFQGGRLSCGGEQKRAIYSTPPSELSGECVGTFSVEIPSEGAQLSFFIGLTDMVRPGQSDGVTFKVSVNDHAVFREHHSSRLWKEAKIDMMPYAGRKVSISFSVGPGPSGDSRFDLAAWGEPQLIPHVPEPFQAELFCPSEPRDRIMDGVDSVEPVTGHPGRWRVTARVPMMLALLFEEPTPIQPPYDLTDAPFEVRIVRPGEEEGVSGYACCKPLPVSCGGLTKPSLFEHPPPAGRTEASFLLDLPREPVAFRTSVGIRDGSLSEGVLFILGVNWKEVATMEMLPSCWENLSVDLSPYAGETILLSLETDPDGWDYYDWAAWGEPRIVPTTTASEAIRPVMLASLVFLAWARRRTGLH